MKEFADDNFKFDENGRKLSKRVENAVEKGEIARYEQFLFFPQCFQKACFLGASKGVIVWEWNNTAASALTKLVFVHRWTHKRTDRLIPVYPKKKIVLRGYNYLATLGMWLKEQIFLFEKVDDILGKNRKDETR